jgi:dihydroorotase
MDLANVDTALVRRAIDAHPDVIVGIKARISRNVAGEHDLEAIRLAHQVTVPLRIPLMVHVGQTFSPLWRIVELLQPGDIVTHVYSPPPNGIFDDNGRIFPQILEGRRRGVLFDIGNGRNGHITWDVAERAIQQGFLPDTISSDLTDDGRTNRVFDLPTVMSKFLMLGMPLDKVIACVTVNAARAVPAFKEFGTLRVGAAADLAVFELQEGNFEFVDNADAKRTGHQKLVPRAVVAGGKRVV